MIKAKYYDAIKAHESNLATEDDGEFDFSVLKKTGIVAMVLSWLIGQRWLYAILRKILPVAKIGNLYIVTRYEDVAYIRKNDALFEAPYGREMKTLTRGENFVLGMENGREHQRQLGFILGRDGSWEGAFRRADIDDIILPEVQKTAKQLLHHSGGEIDVIHDYLTRISVETCARYYGLEPIDPNAFAQWLMSLSALLFADYTGDETTRKLALIGSKRIGRLVAQAIDRARLSTTDPEHFGADYNSWIQNTVIGRLVAMQNNPNIQEPPSDAEISAMIIGLAVGFVPTGASAGGNILEVLFKNKNAMEMAKNAAQQGDDAALSAVLTEAMRFKPPIIPGLPRYVRSNIDPSKKIGANSRVDKIPGGATILAASISAMFDKKSLGSDIGKFKPERKLSKEDLQFGGAGNFHYCFGEQIFNNMIREAFKPLLKLDNLKRPPGKSGRIEKIGPFPQHLTLTYSPVAGHRKQSMITICVPLATDLDFTKLNEKLDRLGNPASSKMRAALDKPRIIHFAHMTAIPAQTDKASKKPSPAYLLVELNADGPAQDAIFAFADHAYETPEFRDVMEFAGKACDRHSIGALLNKHHYPLSIQPWHFTRKKTSGLNFPGNPELSADRIVLDSALARDAKNYLDEFTQDNASIGLMPSEAIAYVRRKIRHSNNSAGLIRPYMQTLPLTRRSTLKLQETIGLFARDAGVVRTLTISILLSSLFYYTFLRVGFPDTSNIDLSYQHILIGLKILGSFLFGALIVVGGFSITALYQDKKSLGAVKKIKNYLGTHRLFISILSILIGTLHLVFWESNIGPDTWGAHTTWQQRFGLVGLSIWQITVSFIMGVIILGVLATGGLAEFLRNLNRSEDGSPPVDTDLQLKKYQEILTKENQPGYAQNHIVLVTPLKSNPKWLRRIALFIGFYFIQKLVQLRFRAGFVLDIGTIHFARWFILPKSHTMIFFSNYDGSGESYFEDFVTKAQWGQTGVWSNAIGFPRTKNLLFEGAKDATGFKRWIRSNQVISRFWYARYPKSTTSQIRTNALICEGLAKAKTDSEYRAWIDLIGSRPRPKSALDTSEIQSLVFGGMGRLRASALLSVQFPENTSDNNALLSDWLSQVSGYVKNEDSKLTTATFDDRRVGIGLGDNPTKNGASVTDPARPKSHAMNIAFSPAGLKRLGLGALMHQDGGHSSSALTSFPAAFRSGMVGPDRQQILGDINENAPSHWKWGADDKTDAVLLLYAENTEALDRLIQQEEAALESKNISVTNKILTEQLPTNVNDIKEPFGFRDGISQPVIKGSRQFQSGVNDIHVVEPGEFILGYKDSAGYYPTTAVVNANAKGAHFLPSLPESMPDRFPVFPAEPNGDLKDLGRNGTFLVVRQLEQHKSKFDTFLEQQASTLRKEYGLDYITKEWVGAKLVGRWKDGSSLLRYPYKSKSTLLAAKRLQDAQAAEVSHLSTLHDPLHSKTAPISDEQSAQQIPSLDRHSDPSSPAKVSPTPRFSDNDFLHGIDDPQGQRCPFSAHIRRANPRDSLAPGEPTQLRISNRHRILRRGRVYKESGKDGGEKGLLFMCLNVNLERQYEFIQQTWINSSSFHGLENEGDVIAQPDAKEKFTIPTASGPIVIKNLQSFITVRGGGYFFMPSRSAIRFFAEHINPRGIS
jgi:deferrochelatase/peroxidase EfeB/cytochrome P450